MSAIGYLTESLADAAFQVIEEKIVTLELAPGSRVTERALCDLTGFGRTPVREALLRLSQGFLIEILPRNGILIAPMDFEVIVMTLEVRRHVERLIVERAARYSDDRDRRKLDSLRAAFQDATDRGDALAFIRTDNLLNQTLNAAARHPVAAKVAQPLHSVSRRMGFALGRANGAGFNVTGPTHQRLIEAVVAGDVPASIMALDELLDAVDALKQIYSTMGGPRAF
ncbi:GntR family transcriptional regulator [Devosia ginsengisoli]|uniref:GntR family transcriptional regulator n=1 Tax=Devosia ginsengisoli TaxID=400770 RepID=UPI0026E9ED93|nr:GntR family transcriptional regulator [Devosia ginsengisoli]MCR6672429.1 GntR family transcriptional regulator [Devosia ginsengisoli]